MIFFHREARFAQVGDVLFQGSIGRTDFPRGNHAELIASITGKLWPLGDDVAFVPGHGPMSTFGQERRSQPVRRRRRPGARRDIQRRAEIAVMLHAATAGRRGHGAMSRCDMTYRRRRPRILMVDDDPGIRDVVSDFLGKHGYEVDTAGGRHRRWSAALERGPGRT